DDVTRMEESNASHHHVGLSRVGCPGRFRESRTPDWHSNRRSQSPRVRLPSTSLRLRARYKLDEHASSLVDWPNVSAALILGHQQTFNRAVGYDLVVCRGRRS